MYSCTRRYCISTTWAMYCCYGRYHHNHLWLLLLPTRTNIPGMIQLYNNRAWNADRLAILVTFSYPGYLIDCERAAQPHLACPLSSLEACSTESGLAPARHRHLRPDSRVSPRLIGPLSTCNARASAAPHYIVDSGQESSANHLSTEVDMPRRVS